MVDPWLTSTSSTLATEPTGSQSRVKLRAVPLFVYDLNYGDDISVVSTAEGPLVATGVTKDSGNYTFRVWFRDAGEAALRDVVTEFGALGCLIEGYGDKLRGMTGAAGLQPK